MEKKIECLVATYNLDRDTIINLLERLNIFCDIILRNQTSFDSQEIINIRNYNVKIINASDKGVSKNRNELLKLASAEYVIFCDDDMIFCDGCLSIIINEISNINKDISAIVFNVKSLTKERPINLYKGKTRLCKFKDVRSDGVWRFCFKRNDIRFISFDEHIGSGTKFLCGEDTLFIKEFIQHYKYSTYISNILVAYINHEKSNWFYNKDCDNYFLAKGHVYKTIYPKLYKLYIIRFLIKEKKLSLANYKRCMYGAKKWDLIIKSE